MKIRWDLDTPYSGEFPLYGAVALSKGEEVDVPPHVAKGLLNMGATRVEEEEKVELSKINRLAGYTPTHISESAQVSVKASPGTLTLKPRVTR